MPVVLNRLSQIFESVVDWFVPDHFRDDPYAVKRVRMFLISHLCGPLIGHPITLALFLSDPNPWPHVWIEGASITLFWAFPFALKIFKNHYDTLSILSVVNLVFAILWGSWNYGGASSPFLMWLLVVPLLAFFYLGANRLTQVYIPLQTAISLGIFYIAYLWSGAFPAHLPDSVMVEAALISTLCASIYVFMMASYYASVVDSQSELLKEIERHRGTFAMLRDAKEDAERAKEEAERAQQEAERANGAKSEFLAKMSHELRTPLNAVLGYSELLLEDAEIEGRGQEIADLQKISAAGKHLLSIVNDVLDISKIEAGKMELFVEEFSLDKFIDEVEFTCRPLAAKNTNSFVVERDDELGRIRTDATKLRQALFNLISNAAKFTQNGQITLTATRERNGHDIVVISVSDTGIGISHEQQSQLFQNFSQADASVSAKFGGTGLGLSLSQNLCRLMGGSISVDSEVGKGATFTIRLPALISDESEDERLPRSEIEEYSAPPVLPAGLQPRRLVLALCCRPELLALAEQVFVEEGYRLVSTDTADAALQLARTTRPRAILASVTSPDDDLWDALDGLKADASIAEIPLIVVGPEDSAEAALEHGVAEFVAEPAGRTDLVRLLRRAEAGPAGKANAQPTLRAQFS